MYRVAYKNWSGVVASTWHGPNNEGKMQVECVGDLLRSLNEVLSKTGWTKKKSLTLEILDSKKSLILEIFPRN